VPGTAGGRLRALLVGLVVVLAAGCGAADEPETVRPLVGRELVQALHGGGHVLYLRHAQTPQDGTDQPGSLGDCTRQRLLDAAGRADARALGEAVRALGVRVGEVLASPYCRTVDTARLAFGRAVVEEGLVPPAPETKGRTTRALRRLLRTVPEDGENTILVGHLTNLNLLSTASPQEGGTVVFRPDGEGFVLVGSVPEQGWQELAATE
jgi:phosphohistidine phosphatase SixA